MQRAARGLPQPYQSAGPSLHLRPPPAQVPIPTICDTDRPKD